MPDKITPGDGETRPPLCPRCGTRRWVAAGNPFGVRQRQCVRCGWLGARLDARQDANEPEQPPRVACRDWPAGGRYCPPPGCEGLPCFRFGDDPDTARQAAREAEFIQGEQQRKEAR